MNNKREILLLASLCWLLLLVNGDPCNTNFGGCDQINGLCWGTGENTSFCLCQAGFYPNETSLTHHCLDVDECGEGLCGDHATCVNTVGSFLCSCKCGYVKDYTGERCLNVYDIRDSCYVPKECCHDIYSGRKSFEPQYGDDDWYPCLDTETKILQPNDCPTCSCKEGFKLNDCGYCTDYDECVDPEDNDCDSQNGSCVNTEGSYYCLCDPGFTLGPCRRRCYNSTETVPPICNAPDLSSLSSSGPVPGANTYLSPFVLSNFGNCAENVSVGDSVTESFDVDGNGENDVTLTWSCINSQTIMDQEENVTITRSSLSLYAEREAQWDPWSCWSVCKATCWGGIQTRTRYCLHGRPGLGGCQGVGSEKRECYTGPKCRFRIRKDIRSLTTAEIGDLVQAMELYKKDFSVRGFHHAAGSHGWPFQCNRLFCCPHGSKMKFVTWHRYIVLNFEEGLVRYMSNKELGIPYWNWLDISATTPTLAWDETILGSPNPFANMTVFIDRMGPMRTINRNLDVEESIVDIGRAMWRDVTRNLMKIHLMHEWAESLEMVHNNPHGAVCSVNLEVDPFCQTSMATLGFAAFDPVFLMHHSQVDRMWAIQQRALAQANSETWTKQTAIEPLDEEGDFGRVFQPYGNKTINSFPIVQNTGNMHDSYYYQELTGIKYESLDDPTPPVAAARFLGFGVQRPEALYIAHYLRNVDVDTYINYYFDDGNNCSSKTIDTFLGRTTLLATNLPNFNSIPNLVAFPTGLLEQLSENVPIVACYTSSSTCQEMCPPLTSPLVNLLPAPGLLYLFPNYLFDAYKYAWSSQNRMPVWNVNIYGDRQIIHFYGDRAENIRQVRNSNDWSNCDTTISRPVPCFGENACMLPIGIYYFVDADQAACNNGLKMIISSAK